MGMGIVSDTDFALEKSKLIREDATSVSATIEQLPSKGRSDGDINVPDSLRKIIGDTATSEGRQEAVALAENFGISASSASAYAVGARSTTSYNDRPNFPVINSARLRIQTKATKKLHQALHALTPEKIGEAKAVEIAAIARSMSAIVKDMEPETPTSPGEVGRQGPTFVFMAPPTMKEESFDVKYVRE